MLPVMGVKKASSDIPRMCQHIWLKLFLNKPMQECRDVRESQESTNYNKKNYRYLKLKKLQLYLCRRTNVKCTFKLFFVFNVMPGIYSWFLYRKKNAPLCFASL